MVQHVYAHFLDRFVLKLVGEKSHSNPAYIRTRLRDSGRLQTFGQLLCNSANFSDSRSLPICLLSLQELVPFCRLGGRGAGTSLHKFPFQFPSRTPQILLEG